ncbi:hypothetical protein BDV95DRAFT_88797 [Massariosphaeria phaeospora]|uniref:Uncharacterized protein n=1 Tax=Massariosphaeria phaeospora TaxID=100035 RepID=A0A7C8I705_9PLEO|nr:hypothetical protein BDV95DRAFT_88797 [Massariosphaeria phaeospora]
MCRRLCFYHTVLCSLYASLAPGVQLFFSSSLLFFRIFPLMTRSTWCENLPCSLLSLASLCTVQHRSQQSCFATGRYRYPTLFKRQRPTHPPAIVNKTSSSPFLFFLSFLVLFFMSSVVHILVHIAASLSWRLQTVQEL